MIETPIHFMLLMFLALFILGAVMGYIVGEYNGYNRRSGDGSQERHK